MRKRALPSAVCEEAFPADPYFPQLQLTADPARMLQVHRKHLTSVPRRQSRIAECIPFRFRCRQSSERCVLQYTLRLVETGTGRELHQWVTGLIYARPGEAHRLCAEMQAADPRRDIPEPWLTFEPVTFIPEL